MSIILFSSKVNKFVRVEEKSGEVFLVGRPEKEEEMQISVKVRNTI